MKRPRIALSSLPRIALNKWGAVLAFLVIWQAASMLGESDGRSLLPPPTAVFRTWGDLMHSGGLLGDVTASVMRVGIGFAVAAFLGVLLGTILSVSPKLAVQFRSLVELIRPIPPIAWIPIAVLWFGIGNASAIFIVALGASFPILVSTYDGIANVQTSYINVARCMNAKRLLIVTDVLLPAALPQIISGLRIGLGIAWTSVIAAELVGAQSGLGYMIQLNRILLQTESVIAGMLTIGLIGLLANSLSYRIEEYLLPWTTPTKW